jgi:cell division septum initiation protein DivIVA
MREAEQRNEELRKQLTTVQTQLKQGAQPAVQTPCPSLTLSPAAIAAAATASRVTKEAAAKSPCESAAANEFAKLCSDGYKKKGCHTEMWQLRGM